MAALNSLSDLLAASRNGQTIDPEVFERIVFGTTSEVNDAQGNFDELTAGLPLPHPQFIEKAILVLGKAFELNGDEQSVLTWFRHGRLSLFAMATPADVIASGRTGPLLEYLDSIAAGSSG